MKIVWDERKRIANLEKHGFDFSDLSPSFFFNAVITAARHGRSKAVGRLNDGTILVVFVALGSEALSVVSMRRARKDERRLLDDD